LLLRETRTVRSQAAPGRAVPAGPLALGLLGPLAALLAPALRHGHIVSETFHARKRFAEEGVRRVYRFDERQNDDGPRFAKAVKRADGRRLTWKVLTDKSGR
jgi:hypothetical protein